MAPLRAALWEKDGPALDEKIDRASFDDSKKGILRRRYESANHMDMHRCLKQLAEQRRQTELRAEYDWEDDEMMPPAPKMKLGLPTDKPIPDATRNKANSSAAKLSTTSTSEKSAGAIPSPYSDPTKYIKSAIRPQEPAAGSAPPAKPTAPPAGEAPKPS